jgi:hypothetical protein
MPVRGSWALAGFVVAIAGCTSILGDFAEENPDATSMDSGGDDGSRKRGADAHVDTGSGFDATARDATTDGRSERQHDASTDAACGAGLTRCANGCVNLDDASANCGACGLDCHGASCAAGTCSAYVIAEQPKTGMVAKLATDGTRVVWSDTGIVAIEQIAATGGKAIALASASSTQGAVSSELALAGRTVAFAYLGVTAPSVGLATVDVADSGTSAISGALAVSAVSLNPAATHLFFVDITGTQGSLNDCPISGLDVGTCVGVVGGGRFLAQTAAGNAYMLFDLTGADTQQAGLYLDTISTNVANIFATDTAQSLAVAGTWAYWTVQNDGGATYAIRRTLESAPTTVAQTPVSVVASSAFASDGVNVYYWTGSAVAAKPVSGGAETTLAAASGFVQIAVGGGLLVWTDGATIWGLVLPAD